MVELFDVTTLRNVGMIKAHKSPLAAMNFDSTGKKIVTASVTSTVVRVFSVPDGQKLFECRRGFLQRVSIGTLAFSPDSTLLLVSSNTNTVHIFKLDDDLSMKKQSEQSSWTSWFTSITPTVVSDALYQVRDFATIKLPFSNLRSMFAFTTIQNVLYVVVVDEIGFLYIYNIPKCKCEIKKCSLVREYLLQDGELRIFQR